MTTERWWAPQRATLEPDAVVLAMLEPGDLGSAVLAAHRAGAAAIETVARSPLPSEGALIDALVTARAAVAGPVVDSVSKSMDGSYAGLLVMDVLDDAEQGALHVYRTAVNKGIAPALAAQRAGEVYGVPPRALSRYAIAASDPKTPLPALCDLADRTLMEYVSKLVAAEERDGEVVTVSKATEEQHHEQRPFRESDVVRDVLGRFAEEGKKQPPRPGSLEWLREQLGLGTGAPKEVAGEPVREARQQRQQRRQRQQRQVRLAPTGRQQAERATPQRAKPQRTAAERATARREMAQRHEHAERINAPARRVQEVALRKKAALTPVTSSDLLAPSAFRGEYYGELDTPVVFHMSDVEAFHLTSQMGDQARGFKGQRVARLGAMLKRASTPPEANGSFDAHEGLAAMADSVLEGADMVTPSVEILTAHDLNSHSVEGLADELTYVERERKDKVREVDRGRSWYSNTSEDAFVHALPIYTSYGDETGESKWAIVHFRPSDVNAPSRREMPTVDEFVVLGNPLGNVEGTTKRPTLDLDPNQVVRIVADPDGRKGALPKPKQFWDPDKNVIVQRWYLEVISEDELDDLRGDVQKAAEEQYARKPFRESDVVRDILGRFADEGSSPVAGERRTQREIDPAQREQRVQRPQRQQRRQRQLRQQRQPIRVDPQRVEATRAPAERAGAQRTAYTRALEDAFRAHAERRAADTTRREVEPDLPMLKEHMRYKVFNERSWDHVMQYLDPDERKLLDEEGVQFRLGPMERRMLSEANNHRTVEVPYRMAINVNADPTLRSKQFEVKAHMHLEQARDPKLLAERIESLFDNNPGLDRIEVIRRGNVLTLNGNVAPAGRQILLEVNQGIDWSKPVYLTSVGKFRARDLGAQNALGDIERLITTEHALDDSLEGTVINPEVHLYRISTQLMRAGN